MCDFLPRHYVYEHLRLDTGEVFYVGKGVNRRAWQTTKRSAYHKNIQAIAGGYNVHILINHITVAEAMRREMEHIASLREQGVGLVNLTDGGEGSSGYVASPEARAKISAAHKGRIHSDTEKARRAAGCKGIRKTKLWRERLSAAHKGKVNPPSQREKARQRFLGTKRSPEIKAKIAASMRALRAAQRAKSMQD
jgi:hypothetical protein